MRKLEGGVTFQGHMTCSNVSSLERRAPSSIRLELLSPCSFKDSLFFMLGLFWAAGCKKDD